MYAIYAAMAAEVAQIAELMDEPSPFDGLSVPASCSSPSWTRRAQGFSCWLDEDSIGVRDTQFTPNADQQRSQLEVVPVPGILRELALAWVVPVSASFHTA